MTMQDRMSMSEGEIVVQIKCAKCGDMVKPNETHTCKEGIKDENSDSGQAPTK